MYLEKLEIQGFKSFANKNTLVFPGMLDESKRGITAVVGPNGSGKSNVADAVRWALGEQSMKILRGKKSEDVIFSGSDKKGKLGMAEVSLHLNNEDGVKSSKSPIDYSQIVITRRLYRDGDSGYMINNNRVRLSDIQMLLARAKFGQKTYSVIGQGMVEGFLNTSLAERKEFFDEATGVKQYQIKRDESLNKLRASYENLSQAQMLLSEIEPRLKSLTRQVGRLRKRGEMEIELKSAQTDYYSRIWHDINEKFKNYNHEYLELEKIKFVKEKKLDNLNKDLEQLKIESEKENEFNLLQNELGQIQGNKDELNRGLAKVDAQMETKLEAGGQHDLSFLFNKKEVINKELKKINEEIGGLNLNTAQEQKKIQDLRNEKEKIDFKIKKINETLLEEDKKTDDNGMKAANKILNKILEDLETAEGINEFEKIKTLALKIKKELKELKNIIFDGKKPDNQNNKLKEAQIVLSGLLREKEELIDKINKNNIQLSIKSERIKLLNEKKQSFTNETLEIEKRLQQNEKKQDFKELEKERFALNEQITAVQKKILAIKEKISSISAREEEKRNRLFSLQKNLQELQNELNDSNNKMQAIKINSTRYETRLEDLEIEIRQELKDLSAIKNKSGKTSELDNDFIAGLREKIKQIKKQLELIGGIDPQTEQEYNETKERFDFLNNQVTDFSSAVDSLRKIIKELDAIIKEQFDKEFKVIAQNFEKYFKILFNGGKAKIVKVLEEAMDEEKEEVSENEKAKKGSELVDLPDIKKIKFLQKHNATGLAGIEIQATPPGKKIGSVSMLSGGERALTAIALICAIISSNPSPFVVLDEVDAALDEANSERLAKILDELSLKTQFIAITHNRASMRRASILYGVTMGDDGISKLLSVKLDEVKGM
ncbi:MAG: AAA family ATPase [Patescibacteria group bacterium]|nr:AAA family ATPase [Patescibacteria group bacterium]